MGPYDICITTESRIDIVVLSPIPLPAKDERVRQQPICKVLQTVNILRFLPSALGLLVTIPVTPNLTFDNSVETEILKVSLHDPDHPCYIVLFGPIIVVGNCEDDQRRLAVLCAFACVLDRLQNTKEEEPRILDQFSKFWPKTVTKDNVVRIVEGSVAFGNGSVELLSLLGGGESVEKAAVVPIVLDNFLEQFTYLRSYRQCIIFA